MEKESKWLYHRNSVALFFLFFGILVFLVGFDYCLWDDDESAYAGFALNMLREDQWIQPHFFWSDVHRKTPLHFWLIGLSYRLFGINEFAVRFPAGIFSIGTLVILFQLGKSLWGREVSILSVYILGSSFLFVALAKISFTDATLLFFETLSILSLFAFLREKRKIHLLFFWLGIGLGVLVKGPPILILCGGLWLFLFMVGFERKSLIQMHPWFFGLISLIPFFVWCYYSYLWDGGKLVGFLLDWYILKRASGATVFGQTGPPGYHLVVILASFLPWIYFLIFTLIDFGKRGRDNYWYFPFFGTLLFSWIFYELVQSKLPTYALAAQPILAIMLAHFMHQNIMNCKLHVIGFIASILILSIIILFSVYSFSLFQLSDQIFLLSFILVIIAIFYFFYLRKIYLISLVCHSYFFLFFVWFFVGKLVNQSAEKSSSGIVNEICTIVEDKKLNRNEVALVGLSHKQLKMSFPFYLQVSFRKIHELTFDQLRDEWTRNPKLVVLMGETFQDNRATFETDFPQLKIIKKKWKSINDGSEVHPFYIVYQEGK